MSEPMKMARCHPDRPAHRKSQCRECERASYRLWYERNIEANRAAAVSRTLAWRAANRASFAASRRAWRERNAETERERFRDWQKANPEKCRTQAQRRRARLRDGDSPGVTADQWRAILERCGHRCAYCGASGVKLTRDHVTPIAKGGRDEPDNVLPACVSCNSAKGMRPLVGFIARLRGVTRL